MKILLVSSGSGSRGGGELYLKLLAEGLGNLGHNVQALIGEDCVLAELSNEMGRWATIHRLKMRSTYKRRTRMVSAVLDHSQQRRIERFFRALAPDVVHINQQVAEDGLDLLFAAKRSGLPFLSTIHITRTARSLGARFGLLRDRVTNTALGLLNARHIVVAEHTRSNLVARLGKASADRITVVHNGVCGGPADKQHQRSIMRNRWGATENDVVLGCVGRLEDQKNPLFTLEVCAELHRRGKAVRLVWIGDGPLRARFTQHARDLEIDDTVRVEGWCNDVENRLPGCDIFMLASHFEGLPLALLEALCAGLPACVSDIEGMSEAVVDGMSGFICKAGNVQHWAVRLERLIDEPQLRAKLGHAAKARACSEFSIERMSRDTAHVYERAIAMDRTRRIMAPEHVPGSHSG